MKKWISFLLPILLVMLSACGTAATSSAGKGGEGKQPVKLVMTNEVPENHSGTKLMRKFAEEVEKKSGGHIDVEVFPAGQLYSDLDAVRALGTGSVHMVWPVTVQLETLNPEMGIATLPFGIADEKMSDDAYRKKLMDLLSPLVEGNGMKVLGLLRTTDGLFVTKSKELKTIEDLKGLKIRMTGGQVLLDEAKALQASAISMPASEMSTALSQGAIDGVLTSPAGWTTILGNSAKYGLYVPGMWIATYTVVADKAWMEGLAAEDQKIITDTIDELSKDQWMASIEEDKAQREKVEKELNGKITTVEGVELEKWKQTLKSVNEAFKAKYPDTYKKLEEISSQ